MNSIKLQAFDTEIFKKDFYRVVEFDIEKITVELSELFNKENIIIDTKIDASNLLMDKFLKQNDFRKISTQVELMLNPIEATDVKFSIIEKEVKISEQIAMRLSENFTADRFSQDHRIDTNLKNKFYKTWILNSFKNPNIYIAYIGNNFCSFKVQDCLIKIDLLSILDKRKGYARDLLSAINNFAIENNIKTISVVTECENLPAYKTYTNFGFIPYKYLSCFHYIG